MLATLALAVAAALGPPVVLPELEHDVLLALGDDNRVGFAFASLTLGAECGVDSTIAHSRAHIAAAAKVLASTPPTAWLVVQTPIVRPRVLGSRCGARARTQSG